MSTALRIVLVALGVTGALALNLATEVGTAFASAPVAASPTATTIPATTATGGTVGTPTSAGTATGSGSTTATTTGSGSATINLGGALSTPSNSLEIIIGLTLLSVAPSLLIMLTSFTRIIIVLSLTRNALGLQSVPPNQVLAGLALFMSLFIMGPTIKAMYHDGIAPYLKHQITQNQAYNRTAAPLRTWMLKQTDSNALGLFAQGQTVSSTASLSMTAVIPAFIVSELKSAFIIGFVIFVPFVVIDLIVSSTLMSMGMMMLPPSLISLPFKLLLFVLVNGWALVVSSLITSFH